MTNLVRKACLVVLLISVFQVNLKDCAEEKSGGWKHGTIKMKYKENATVDCSKIENVEFYIKKEGELNETQLTGSEKNVEIDKDKGILTLIDIRGPEINSEYYCKKGSKVIKEFKKEIEAHLYKPEKISQTISEGSRVEFKCTLLFGDKLDLKWNWKKNGTDVVQDDRINITSSDKESILSILKVNENDKGDYECEVNNKYGGHSEKLYLRVKDALAALWPFLGICGEVVILCIVLLIFEKKCTKKRQNPEEDNEQTHNLMGKEGETKKRIVKA